MTALFWIASFFLSSLATAQTAPGTISGQLRAEAGQRVEGVRVSALAVPDAKAPASTGATIVGASLTDAAGRYRIEGVPPGQYYVMAGLLGLSTYYPGTASANAARAITVAAGSNVTGIDFTAANPSGFKVTGRVVRPAGTGVAGQDIALFGGGTPIETTVNAEGSFEFARVLPGTYSLLFSTAGLQPPSVIVTVSDRDVAGINVVVPAVLEISGVVHVDGGGLVPRMVLSFSPFRGGITPLNAPTQAGGAFHAQLPEGDYRLAWTGLPAGYEVKSITSGNLDLLAAPLRIAADAARPPINVTLGVSTPAPWVRVRGKVTGLPADGTAFHLSVSGASLSEPLDITLNADGAFEIPQILAGVYTVGISPQFPTPPLSLVVPPTGQDLTGVVLALPVLKEIVGRVAFEGPAGTGSPRLTFSWLDRPQPGAEEPPIVVTALAGGSVLGSRTGSANAQVQPDGTFRVRLPEGERTLRLSAPGFVVRSFVYGAVDALKAPVKLSATDSAEFRITLTPNGPRN